MNTPLLSIIHPTRNIANAWPVKQAWLKAAKNPSRIEYLIGSDLEVHCSRNPMELAYARELGIHYFPSQTSVQCNNFTAQLATSNLLVMFQDDLTLEPPEHWDIVLMSKLPEGWENNPLVLAIGCGIHNPNGSSLLGHFALNRKAYETLGYFVHPAYAHTHADDHQSYLAWKRNWVLDLRREIIWKHERCRTPAHETVTARTMNSTTNGKDWFTIGHETFHNHAKALIDQGLDLPLDFVLPQ